MFKARAALLMLLSVLCGCTAADNFTDRMTSMNVSFDEARNNMLLLNILRAGQSHPLTFLAVTNVSAAQGAGMQISAPVGSLKSNWEALSWGISNNNVSANFSGTLGVTPLESKEFYQGLLQPLSLNAVQFLLTQGYPRQVLYQLLFESVRLRSGTREKVLWNDPTDENYAHFQRLILHLIARGATLEAVVEGQKSHVRLCIDRSLVNDTTPSQGPVCGQPDSTGKLTTQDEELGISEMEVVIRSTYGVFRYLGRLTNPEYGDRVQLVGHRAGGIVFSDDRRLLPLVVGVTLRPCVAKVMFLGTDYCLPAKDAEQGPLIMQLLAQLVALNVSVRDLPAVPTVRLTN